MQQQKELSNNKKLKSHAESQEKKVLQYVTI